MNNQNTGKCPFHHGATSKHENPSKGTHNADWWPNKLNLQILRQHNATANPLGNDFNYAQAFLSLNLQEVKKDVFELMTNSQSWWPADYGHYGPFFIRMAWHSAGTYRIADGRGGSSSGAQRFAPLNSWPDNGNLDKARMLLWPIKQKYGAKLSWADLMILAGNCALESMGFKTKGFAGGREDVWEPEQDIYWGKEKTWLGNERYSGDRDLENPLAAVQMGLIYVNPEGPDGVPDPIASARDIRETFGRMAMNDEETVALIAGGHSFGKAHGAASASYVGPEPEGANMEAMGKGWINSFGKGHAEHTITSGIEGAWKPNPTTWDNGYLETLIKYDWKLVKSPAGAFQWIPTDETAAALVADAHEPNKFHAPIMTTADLALKMDEKYKAIAKKFAENFELFEEAFAKAWFKLTHRDLGPVSRYLGSEVPTETWIWQDPLPKTKKTPINKADEQAIKQLLQQSGLLHNQAVFVAWASASTFRGSDKRGGANGARIRFAPQNNWPANNPALLQGVLHQLTQIQHEFNQSIQHERHLTLADLIVLAGNWGIEQAAQLAGHKLEVPFTAGRVDANEEETDAESFAVLEPKADGFRNYQADDVKHIPAEVLLVDKAQLLQLSIPEMTVLIGGLRAININQDQDNKGVFTVKPGQLTNDFFKVVTKPNLTWKASDETGLVFEAYDAQQGHIVWKGTRADLIFGSNAELRAVAEVYASQDAEHKFLQDFVHAWNKVMNADRFDV